MTVERDWFWFWFWFYCALWLASVFTLVLVLRQSSENRSKVEERTFGTPCNLCSNQARKWPRINKTFFKKAIVETKKKLTQNCLPFFCCVIGVISAFTIIIKFRYHAQSGWLKKLVTFKISDLRRTSN